MKATSSQLGEQQDILFNQLKSTDELVTIIGERLKPVRCTVPCVSEASITKKDVVKIH